MPKTDILYVSEFAEKFRLFHEKACESIASAKIAAICAGLCLLDAKSKGVAIARVADESRIGRRTAFRYLALVDHLLPGCDPTELLSQISNGLAAGWDGCAQQLPAQVTEAIQQTDGKSLTAVYESAGLLSRRKSSAGGARPGAGRPRALSPAEMMAQAAQMAADPELARGQMMAALRPLWVWAMEQDGISALDDESRRILAAHLQDLLARLK